MSYEKYKSFLKTYNFEEQIFRPNDDDNGNNDNDNDNGNSNGNDDTISDSTNDSINNNYVNDANDLNAVNNAVNAILLEFIKHIKLFTNEKYFLGIWFITLTTTLILYILTIGIFNLYQANEIIYEKIGFYTFQIYYIVNIIWYGIFFIVHMFLFTTQLFYTIDKTYFIKYIIINYRHIRYNIIITKTLFIMSLSVILTLYNDNNTIILPVYYNIIFIETVLSLLLIVSINNILMNISIINNLKILTTTTLSLV